jgi:hypothetical protein
MVAVWTVRGRWSDAALDELRAGLAVLLPGRASCRVVRLGIVRVVIFVGVTPNYGFGSSTLEDTSSVYDSLQCAEYIFARLVARLTDNFPLAPGVQNIPGMYESEPQISDVYRLAEAALGDDPLPDVGYRDSTAEWVYLHETTPVDLRWGRYNFYEGRAYRALRIEPGTWVRVPTRRRCPGELR